MSVAMFEGIIENGRVKLPDSVRVAEKTKVYVVIPGVSQPGPMRLMSPRLAHPEQAKDFKKTVIPDANRSKVTSSIMHVFGRPFGT